MYMFRVKCIKYGKSREEEIIIEAQDTYDVENKLSRDGYKVISIIKVKKIT